ncbi:hypothetical protein PROFUN_10163 [Planoprotostelium fungivorum]|uniref:SET domain-containing protein n=1 Tax=Planoprotostelium fungivorum TaxID=1890364 RepID=A0A2P6NEK1_9EUKA|nr:hypothetical protein PROFUN_10163 [Planoprotostelium fungivorum]
MEGRAGFPFRLQMQLQRGRFLVSTRDIKIDEAVFRGLAIGVSISDTYKRHICATCFFHGKEWIDDGSDVSDEEAGIFDIEKAKKLSVSSDAQLPYHCKDCQQVYYCSIKCAEGNISQNDITQQSQDFRAVRGDHWKVTRARPTTSHGRHCHLYQRLSQIHLETESATFTRLLIQILSTRETKHTSDQQMGEKEEEWVADMVSRVASNCFRTWTPDESKCYGRGALFPLASYFNHSCEPNCFVSSSADVIEIITLRDVSEGEELTFRYIDVNQTRDKRRQQLWDSYQFMCACSRCAS